MFPTLSYNDSVAAVNDFYRLYLVPGAAHCNTNSLEANGPFPTTNLAVMIDWVENGVEPVTLNATHLAGTYEGQSAQICSWPLRPMWLNNGTTMECQYDQASIDSWLYDMDAYPMPLY
jgi:tannase